MLTSCPHHTTPLQALDLEPMQAQLDALQAQVGQVQEMEQQVVAARAQVARLPQLQREHAVLQRQLQEHAAQHAAALEQRAVAEAQQVGLAMSGPWSLVLIRAC
jgi:hypothetical protein